MAEAESFRRSDSSRSSRRSLAAVFAFGLASALMYAFGITAGYPLEAGLQAPRGSWSTLVTPSGGSLALHLAVYAALTVVFVLALRWTVARVDECEHPRALIAIVIVIWLLSSLALLGAYPGGESHDIFDYLFRGRMQTEHGASPLAVAPNQYSRAAFYRYIAWYNHVDTYGPVWEYASRAVAEAVKFALKTGGGWAADWPACPDSQASCRMLIAYVTGYRLLSIGLTGLCGLLVFAIARSLRPRLAPAALLAWFWNPVVLISTALGAHNDSLMCVLVLAAFYFCQKHHWLAGLLALVLAAHVKLTALLFAPVLLVWLLAQRGWRPLAMNLALTVLVSLPLSWALYEPLGGWATLPRMLHERGLYLANSPAALAYRLLLEDRWPASLAVQISTQTATWLFAGSAAICLLSQWRAMMRIRRMTHSAGPLMPLALRTALAIVLAYLLVGSFWFQHWYLIWVLAAAALMPDAIFIRSVLPWLGFGAMAGNIVLDMASNLPGMSFSRVQTTTFALALTWLPPVAACLILWTSRAIPWRRPGREIAAHMMK